MQTGAPQAVVTTPGTQKSIFGRLGIRKPSILSLSSPQPPKGSSAARTFSLDDLLRPVPRRKLEKHPLLIFILPHILHVIASLYSNNFYYLFKYVCQKLSNPPLTPSKKKPTKLSPFSVSSIAF
jgi:hypothetical protein